MKKVFSILVVLVAFVVFTADAFTFTLGDFIRDNGVYRITWSDNVTAFIAVSGKDDWRVGPTDQANLDSHITTQTITKIERANKNGKFIKLWPMEVSQ